jgi:dihydrofolate synthase/folylpolyglutamate synthase
MDSSVVFVDGGDISSVETGLDGQVFHYKHHKNLRIPLLGEHQLRNAAVAIEVVEILRTRGWGLSRNALENGLGNTVWFCRFGVIIKNAAFIVDVAHNPQGIRVTLDALEKLTVSAETSSEASSEALKAIFIFGVLADKDYEEMARLLAPRAKMFFLASPNNPRALPATELENSLRKHGASEITVCDSVEAAVQLAKRAAAPSDIICALGSLSMMGGIRNLMYPTQG